MQYSIWVFYTKSKQSCRYWFFNVWNNLSSKLFFLYLIYFLVATLSLYFIFNLFASYTQIQLVRFLSIWFGVVLLVYWVYAAVWCLYDKDDYGRGVSASDDFYNTSFTALWLVEGFLLSLFLLYARLFDFYEPFVESEEIENTFLNEDVDLGVLKLLLISFVITIVTSAAVDFLLSFEALNSFWVVLSVALFVGFILLSFLRVSVRFIEEFDFEEDGEDIFDDVDLVFEHEDFPEEGFDGGDYAEGYEILQLFLGYWHYMLVALHIVYLSYALFAAQGKQTHIYWGFMAICQNIIIILILDYLDWVEVFSTFEIITFDTIYPWFFVTEDNLNIILFFYYDIVQILLNALSAILNFVINTYMYFTTAQHYLLTLDNLHAVVLEECLV